MRQRAYEGNEIPERFTDILLDEGGLTPCSPGDGCSVCDLFSVQRPDEDRAAWLERVIGAALGFGTLEAAS